MFTIFKPRPFEGGRSSVVRSLWCLVVARHKTFVMFLSYLLLYTSGPRFSKLTMSLVNVSLKFLSSNMADTLIFLLKKCDSFFQQKYLLLPRKVYPFIFSACADVPYRRSILWYSVDMVLCFFCFFFFFLLLLLFSLCITCENKVLLREPITKTCLYNVDPLKPHFYIVKLGFTGVYIIFLISAQKHRFWLLIRTASARRF